MINGKEFNELCFQFMIFSLLTDILSFVSDTVVTPFAAIATLILVTVWFVSLVVRLTEGKSKK